MSIITCTFTSANIVRVAQRIEKNLRFAAAMALTNVARDAQQEIIRQLPERFTIRTGWLKKGIRFKPADKNAKDIMSRVVDVDSFMAFQETGGDKTKEGGRDFSIPIGARPLLTMTTPPSKWPGALLAKMGKGYFLAPLTGKALDQRSRNKKGTRTAMGQVITHGSLGKMALWKRQGKQRLPIDLIYIFQPVVHMKPRFGFYDTVRKVTHERLPIRMQEAVNQAARTAR